MDKGTRTERWLPVVGYAGYYEVSNRGRVRSVARTVVYSNGAVRKYQSKILCLKQDGKGRPQVGLSRDGLTQTKRVHHLVLEAFVGLRPPGTECCHADDYPGNNWDCNLSWGSRSDNMNDRVRNGIHHKQRVIDCPEGHNLISPNLVRCKLKLGQRNCLACARARGSVQAAGRRGEVRSFRAEAARHYRQIMRHSA